MINRLAFLVILTLVGVSNSFADMATYNPSTGIVKIPKLIIDGDLHGDVYTVDLQQRGSNFTFDLIRAELVDSNGTLSYEVVSDGYSNFLHAVTKSNDMYVAVGSNCLIATSSNATQWQEENLSCYWDLESVAWSPDLNLFVAVGGWDGTILVSSDGKIWQQYQAPIQKFLRSVIWANNQFIASGMGTIISSYDGKNWTASTLPTTKEISDVVYNGNTYIAIGGSNGSLCFVSDDGQNWQQVNNLPYSGMIFGIASSGERSVAVGWGGTIIYSDDAHIWEKTNSNTYNNLYDISWNGKRFIAVGDNGTIVSSLDGIEWEAVESGTTDILSGVFADDRSIIVGGTVGNGTILISY